MNKQKHTYRIILLAGYEIENVPCCQTTDDIWKYYKHSPGFTHCPFCGLILKRRIFPKIIDDHKPYVHSNFEIQKEEETT